MGAVPGARGSPASRPFGTVTVDEHPYTDHSMAWLIARHLAERPEDAGNPRFLKLKLSFQQPSASPEYSGHGDLDYPGLIDPPGVYASNERLIRWRNGTVIPSLGSHPIWAVFLRRVEMILEWRAAVPAHLRFWRTAESEAHRGLLHGATGEGLSLYARQQ